MGDRENGEVGDWACPAIIQEQIEQLNRGIQDVLEEHLEGLYVHGSLALGGFNPERIDIDLLVVTRTPLTVEIKHRAAELLLCVSGNHCPVEVTVVTADALRAGEHPMALEFHYSEMWRGQYEAELANGTWRDWNRRVLHDPDLAGQVAVARQHGITLCGAPGARALPLLPDEHVRASFLQDCEGALAEIESDPVYGVLNPLRTYCYLLTGRLISKSEAGRWASEAMPPAFRPIVARALAEYVDRENDAANPEAPPTEAEFTAFSDYLRERIRPRMERNVHVSSANSAFDPA